jgi:predicted nucleic acid-binding protein
MILLDTNIVSEPYRSGPNHVVRAWLDAQPPEELFLCTPVLAELRYGVERLPAGTRRERLDLWVRQVEEEGFPGRVLPFDRNAAHEFGRVVARRNKLGRPVGPMDALIASIALAQGASIATRDVSDFEGVGLQLINPFVVAES